MKKFFVALMLVILILPLGTFADGMQIPYPNRYIYESSQQAAIFFENKTEELFLSVSFKGDSEEFAWLVPTPSEPEVSKGPENLFSDLGEYAVQKDPFIEKYLSWFSPYSGRVSVMENSGDAISTMAPGIKATAPKVEVIEEKQVGAYDTATLKADNTDVLEKWLNENGFMTNFSKDKVITEYIKKGWYFVAMKVNQDYQGSSVKSGINEGTVSPIYLKFSTDKVIYPLKISSVNSSNVTSDNSDDYDVYEEEDLYSSDSISRYRPSYPSSRYQTVDVYLFADQKYQADNYSGTTEYAEKLSAKKVNKFFSPEKTVNKSYFLSKITLGSMSQSSFKADLFFKKHQDQKEIGTGKMNTAEWMLTLVAVPASIMYFPVFISFKFIYLAPFVALLWLVAFIVFTVKQFINPKKSALIVVLGQTYLLIPCLFGLMALTMGFLTYNSYLGDSSANTAYYLVGVLAIISVVLSFVISAVLSKAAIKLYNKREQGMPENG